MTLFDAAIKDFEMIKDGDRVLVALSGDSNSIALVHFLKSFQLTAPIKFTIGAVTCDSKFANFNPSQLTDYLKSFKVPFFIEEMGMLGISKSLRRACIYKCARRENYNVVAYSQNLDDFAESFV